jgi:hypothetical protein
MSLPVKRPRREPLEAAAVALAAGVLLALFLLIYAPGSGRVSNLCTNGIETTGPIPACFLANPSPEYQSGGLWFYPFNITVVACPMSVSNLSFELKSTTGASVPFTSVTLSNSVGRVLASYNYSVAAWNFGASGNVSVGMALDLQTPTSSSDDTFWINAAPPNCVFTGLGFPLS